MNQPSKSQAQHKSASEAVEVLPAAANNAYSTVIPFNRLRLSAANVRRSGRDSDKYREGIKSLAASILSTHQQTGQGLLQNLVVHVTGEFFDVAAGGRRFDALTLLVEQGEFAADYPVACLVIGDEAVTAASLAENVKREAMHPADEFDAFKALTEQGWTIDRIADGFGVSTLVVERRLKLRAAAPALIEEYRQGTLTTEQLVALCASDDHDRQIDVWSRLRGQHWSNDPASLRRAVIETEVEASKDSRVAFIGGVEAYEQAGGVVRRDLFAQDGQGAILADSALVDVLVEAKLQALADAFLAEGWSWAEVWTSFDYTRFHRLGNAPIQLSELSAADSAQLEAMENELTSVQATIEELDDQDDEQAQILETRYDELTDAVLALQQSREGYATEVIAHAGVVVSLNHGALRIDRGMVRAADRGNVASALGEGEKVTGGRESEPAGRKSNSLSDALRRSLLGHRNLAAQSVTATNPQAAKILMVCKFITEVRRDWSGAPTDLSIGNGAGSRNGCPISDEAGQAKQAEFEALGKQLIEKLPQDKAALWDALAALSGADLDELLAFAVARSVSLSTGQCALTDKYVQALGLQMHDHFAPTVANYLGRVSKEQILEALTEADKVKDEDDRAALLALKKGALAAEAETRLTGTGWVPALMRMPEVKPVAKQGKAKGKPAKA